MSADIAKYNAAEAALDFIKDGMIVGLGTGSTAAHFVRLLGARVREGLKVSGVPTSEATRALAVEVGVPLLDVETIERIDVVVDGADEVDPEFRLIKGGGAALLREKIIAAASAHMVVIADEAKWVDQLGAFPLPVEVVRFGAGLTAAHVRAALRETGCAGDEVRMRAIGGEPIVTDGGNIVLDAQAGRIPNPEALAVRLNAIPGVVEHGLFIGLAQTIIIGKAKGVAIKGASARD